MNTLLAQPLLADSDHWDGPGWWIIIPILWFVLFALVIVNCTVRARRSRGHWGSQAGEAKLAERFATGDIDEAEYRKRLAVLKEHQ